MKIKIPDIREIEKIEKEQNRFAKGLNFYKLFWMFFIGCFLGVVLEVIFCILSTGGLEKTVGVGVIWGPFNLVYGLGALAMALGLHILRSKRDLSVMLGGILIGTVVEYICSFVQEFMFGSVSWDYSDYPFNIGGRVNLLYSLFWGILAIFWIKIIYPYFASWILKIPNTIGKSLTWVLLVFMIINTVASGLAVSRWSQRIEGTTVDSPVFEFFDTHYPDEKMEKIFASMEFKPK